MALTHWWKLNGNMHDDGIDSQELTFTGTGSFDDGPMGKYLKVTSWPGPKITGMTRTSELTVCCWAIETNANTSRMMWSFPNPAGGADISMYSTDNTYCINTGDSSANPFINGSTVVPRLIDSTWHHYTVTFSGTSPAKLYIDGAYAGTAKNYINIAKENSSFEIGNSSYYSNNYYVFNTGIYDVRIYDECLSPTEIKEISNGCVVHFDFEDPYLEGTVNLGGSSTSYSGRAFDGTNYRSCWGNIDGEVTYYSSGGYNNQPYADYHITTYGNNASTYSSGGLYDCLPDDIEIIAGKTYTFSIYIRADIEYDELPKSFCICRVLENGNTYITSGSNVHITKNWERHTHTFTATSDQAGMYSTCNIIYHMETDKDYHVQYSCFQIEENDHATPFTPTYREYPGKNIIDIEKPFNRSTGTTVGGWTFSGKSIIVDYSSTLADSYFIPNLKEGKTIEANTLYCLSFDASGFPTGNSNHNTFKIYDSSGDIYDCRTETFHTIRNGHNQFLFNSGPNAKAIVDDDSKSSNISGTMTNFKLIKVEIPDCAGYCQVGSLVGSQTLAGTGTIVDEYIAPIAANPTTAYTIVSESNCGKYSLHTTGALSVDLGRVMKPTKLMITAWVKTKATSSSTNVGPILFTLSSEKTSDQTGTFLTQYGSSNNFYTNGGSTPANIPSDEWMFYVFNYDSYYSELCEYRDGVLLNIQELNITNDGFRYLTIGGNYLDGTLTSSEAYYSDFKMYINTNPDITTMYNRKCSISKINKVATKYFKESDLYNMLEKQNAAIYQKTWVNGLEAYQQTNAVVTLTDKGIRLYRTPNIDVSAHNNYGGPNIDNSNNWLNLQKGHSYLIKWHISGFSCIYSSTYWTNFYGWGGGGLLPNPTVTDDYHYVPDDNTYIDEECYYEFTINDNVYKTCTESYNKFVAGKTYLSYQDFVIYNNTYGTTNSSGTDIYINNLRMYDITGLSRDQIKILKENSLSCGDIYEYTPTDTSSYIDLTDHVRFNKHGTVIANEFIEN